MVPCAPNQTETFMLERKCSLQISFKKRVQVSESVFVITEFYIVEDSLKVFLNTQEKSKLE